MSENLDPEEIHSIMDGCFEILMAEIHKYEGTINQFTGDGIMAIFGAPLAHEDHAQRACNSALSLQKILQNFGDKIKRDYGIDFKMRIGLNSGLVVVGSIGDDLRMDYTAIGDTTNLAARIQQAADPGEVWMSKDTRNIVRDYFQDEVIRDMLLKGKSQPEPVYRLIKRLSTVRTRFEADLLRGITGFVGRNPELETLHSTFERSKKGEAQVFDIIGEAGVGKSRLVYEFSKTLDDDALFLTGLCIHYGLNINFLPVIDIVREAFEISEGMTEEDAARKIEENAVDDLIPMIPFYQNLLSITVDDPNFDTLNPEGRKFGTFEAVKKLLLVLSKKKPLVLFLEDVHWMDKISEEFFAYFSRAFLEYPILMISNYRPECTPQWAQGAHYQRLGLEALSSKSSIKLIHNILGGVTLEPHLEKKIVERTGGNPFFVEEIVRELIGRKDLVKRGDKYVSNQPIDQLEIPGTIQGVLAARLDRLSEDLKKTMLVASVIGRDFAFRLLKSIMEFGDEIRGYLSNLVGLEILYEKALYPELEYIFKHALTREVAYESLLKQRRKEIHDRIAQAIEQLHAGRLEEHYEDLAHHYGRSDNAPKAVDYLILAGEKSNNHGAAQAAYEFFQKALELAASKNIVLDAETKIRMHQGRAMASLQIGAIGPAEEGFRKAYELSRHHKMINYEKESLRHLSTVMWMWPQEAEAEHFFEEGIARAIHMKDKEVESWILGFMGIRAAMDGKPYKGNQMTVDAERLAMETGSKRQIFQSRHLRAFTERWLGKPSKTIELTEGMLEIMLDMLDVSYLSYMLSNRGVALAEIGRVEEGIASLKYGIDICEKYGVFDRLGALYNSLGYCYGEIYQTKTAWKFNLRGEEIARRLMEQYPMGRLQFAEIAAQSSVNLMENLFDQGKPDAAWDRIKSLEEEAKSADFDMFRYLWESRMNYLAARVLLQRNDIGQAEKYIQKCLEIAQREHLRKREGSYLRLLGELQIGKNEYENAVNTLNKGLSILEDVGNPRLLWEAYSSLALAFKQIGRTSEARNYWGLAADIIDGIANNLSDVKLKSEFLGANQIKEILSYSGA
jgi:class 3 adenylate cyclase/tetratricopeptide (TPR) repeat protein